MTPDPNQSPAADAPLTTSLLLDATTLERLGVTMEQVAILVVDHGSRRQESNALLLEVADALCASVPVAIVEPAHMELAEPSIPTAFRQAVKRGARLILVFPYFLAPGRHWQQDIPRLVAQAARSFPDVRYLVTAPLGLHPLMLQIMQQRIGQCLQRALGDTSACEICDERGRCDLHAGGGDLLSGSA